MSSKPSDKYPTSSTAKCLIGGYWIDDVHRIEYKEINGKVPLQGWNQKYIADVADGQCMIQETLLSILLILSVDHLVLVVHKEITL
jgi:hypothetical protein